ncbi:MULTISPECIES: ABC transporter permease subunit [Alicyclobacillus]|nr:MULTISPECIES: ABC transporter permease subunit [Alicyclobacillus]MBF8377330.1 ABC transporter permease subunit [Alicyclobacillus mali (ex Roth et al. 2021)]MCL6488048.1 ABC transporter permease subunit [Alicyclobacillus mali (ex Roth et al. 2021)]
MWFWNRVAPWVLPVAVLVIWQALGSAGVISRRILPTPLGVVDAALMLARQGVLWTYIATSAARAFSGFFIGATVGFTLGTLNGISKKASRLLDTPIQMIRTIPHLALVPLVIVWFGIGEQAKVFLVALGTAIPMYMNTYFGIQSLDPGLLEMARVYRFSRLKMFGRVILPGALPSVLSGVRYSLGVMWVTLIVAETISANSGIGYMVMNAQEFMQMNIVVLGVVLYALLGKLSDVIARVLETRLLRWHPIGMQAV